MKCIILAADQGVRPDTTTPVIPASLLPVKGAPVISYILSRLSRIDSIRSIYIVAGSRFKERINNAACVSTVNFPIVVIDNGVKSNRKMRGSLGDLLFACSQAGVSDDFLVIGADNLFSFNLGNFIESAKKSGRLLTVGLYNTNGRLKPSKFGFAAIDSEGKLTSFTEKPSSMNGSRLISTSIYFFSKENIPLINKYLLTVKASAAIGSYVEWLSQKNSVGGYVFKGSWFDVADSDAYHEAIFSF
ncbi:MAG: sugar phosphate nucleotidyltransferase [Candidatus Omnitrophota bacterium]